MLTPSPSPRAIIAFAFFFVHVDANLQVYLQCTLSPGSPGVLVEGGAVEGRGKGGRGSQKIQKIQRKSTEPRKTTECALRNKSLRNKETPQRRSSATSHGKSRP
ncbi:hypothetical protein BZA77DRAFT_312407 [Pyronema omphalodes]|nr:hypothetical protein BZA77DRAFT_312407 [Pyronema omphalodes]